jgi:tetratricopeptide (TPR) repeat protein
MKVNKLQGLFYILFGLLFWILSSYTAFRLWIDNYLNLREQYQANLPFYEVLVESLGNIRYTLASYFWIRTEYYIHYSGNVTINNLPEIVYYARFITVLDPNFVEAYDFGAFQLGFFIDKPIEGLSFCREGIKNNPLYWKLYFTAGILYSQKLKDYKNALYYFSKAEKLLFDQEAKRKYSYIEIKSSDVGQMYRFIAKSLYEERDYKKALEYYNKSYIYIPTKSALYNEILKKLDRR